VHLWGLCCVVKRELCRKVLSVASRPGEIHLVCLRRVSHIGRCSVSGDSREVVSDERDVRVFVGIAKPTLSDDAS